MMRVSHLSDSSLSLIRDQGESALLLFGNRGRVCVYVPRLATWLVLLAAFFCGCFCLPL
jgi:hypothetical protein